MKAKKILALIAAVILTLCAVLTCACQKDGQGYTLVTPDGAPALAIACLDSEISTDNTVYNIKKKIVPASSIQSEAIESDLAIVPANLASIIFNGGKDIKILAVVTHGNLFVLSSQQNEIEGLDGLVGKLVYSIGQNSVPDIIFKTLLKDKDITFKIGERAEQGVVTINYCAQGSEVNSKLILAKSQGEEAYGVYAEPDVSIGKGEGLKEVLDLQKLWAEYSGDVYGGYAQAVLIAKSSVCEDSDFVVKLLEELDKNKERILKDAQLAENSIKSIYPQTSLKGNLDADVIARCNINTLSMENGKEYYEKTLNAIMQINPKLIGGKLPDVEFYCVVKGK